MRKYYFQVASVMLFMLSLIAFSDNLVTDVGQESNSDPMFIIHGLIMFAWFLIFVIQTNFIRKGNYKAHKKLGIYGILIAIGVFLSTLYVFISVYKGWDAMPYYVKANRFFMLSFVVCIYLGYINRQNGENHKRYIYIASLFILEPILSRVSGNLHIENGLAFMAIVWNGFFISLFLYDWIILKKIHKISWMGFVWFYMVYIISMII